MYSGLSRSERWILLGLIVVIGIGLILTEVRDRRHTRQFVLAESSMPDAPLRATAPPRGIVTNPLPAPEERIDLNTATFAELQRLDGIGPSKAETILRDRANNGPFASVDDLQRVKGIGPSTLERIRPFVGVDEPKSLATAPTPPPSGSHLDPADTIASAPGPAALDASPQGNDLPPANSRRSAPGLIDPSTSGNAPTSAADSAPPALPSPPSTALPPVATPPPYPSQATPVPFEAPVNINTANLVELKRLNGVGDVLAVRILEYRSLYGPFQRPEDLMKVKGIGPKTLEKNRHIITVK